MNLLEIEDLLDARLCQPSSTITLREFTTLEIAKILLMKLNKDDISMYLSAKIQGIVVENFLTGAGVIADEIIRDSIVRELETTKQRDVA